MDKVRDGRIFWRNFGRIFWVKEILGIENRIMVRNNHYVWITNLDIPDNLKIYLEIQKLGQEAGYISGLETDYGNSRMRIEMITEKNLAVHRKIWQKIEEISYIPITATYFSRLPLSDAYNNGLEDIFKGLVRNEHYFETVTVEKYIQKVKDGYITVFRPRDKNNYSLYCAKKQTRNVSTKYNLNHVFGYEYVTDDLLSEYALKDYWQMTPDIIDWTNFRKSGGLTMVRIRDDNLNTLRIIPNMNEIIENYRIQGYVIDDNIDNIKYYDELLQFWPIKKIDSLRSGLILQSTADYYISFESWLKQTINRIAHGYLPQYRLSGQWLTRARNFYVYYKGDVRGRALLFFGAILAYTKLAEIHPEYKAFLFDLTVESDLSVIIPIGNYDHVTEYRQYLDLIMTEYRTWSIWYTDSPIDAIVMRYYVQDNHTDLTTIAFHLDKKYYCLVRTTQQPIEFPFDLLPTLKQHLTQVLANYYSSCQPISSTDNLSLPDNPSIDDYLFFIQTSVNPCQYHPYPTSKAERNYQALALFGFFNTGPIKGFYPTDPSLDSSYLPNLNQFTITIEPYHHLYIVKIDTLSLFLTPSAPSLLSSIQTLWNNGYFLNDWALFYLKSTHQLSKSISRISSFIPPSPPHNI